VLPVMIQPTPSESVPAYLKAVTILEPSGNIAAEVADAVKALRAPRVAGVILVAASVVRWHLSAVDTAISVSRHHR
jgi:hypothetical protein